MPVICVGLNRQTVALEMLERFTVSDTKLPKALRELTDGAQVSEAVLLSTCMRTEIYAVVDRFHDGVDDILGVLARLGSSPPGDFADDVYSSFEEGAATHLFEVAAGIDSPVLGEGEILGQVRHAWGRAREESAAGPVLSPLFRHAVEVGKRARSETGIARGITSLSQAAVALVRERLGGSLEGYDVLMVGAGEVAEGIAAALAASPEARRVMVSNRTQRRAVELARRVGGEPVELGALAEALATADVVLTCTGSPSMLLEASDLVPGLARRRGRPLLVMDIAMPRDVDPGVGRLPGVTLLDMDDLRAFAESGLAGRRQEVAPVRALIVEELERYREATAARSAAPLVAALRARAENVRTNELDRYRSRLDGLDPRQREAVEALTKGILGKLLHEPTMRVKEAAGTPTAEQLGDALRTLFDLS
ncbi:MAG TPA: glutamyl-tRNA reductase [Acidimicrobiales bacterium]|nr:glutamyl-tRNA reductase [Acidimicrobiales bacterium]